MGLTKALRSTKEAGPAVLGAAKIVLDQVDAVADLIPVPWVGTAVSVVQGIVGVIQTMEDNEEQCRALLVDLGEVVRVVLKPFANRRREELPADLLENVNDLIDRLNSTKGTVEELSEASLLNRVFLSDKRKQALVDCDEQIKSALRLFVVTQQINSALNAEGMKKQITAVQSQIEVGMAGLSADIKAGNEQASVATVFRELSSTVLPPRPEVLFGRDTEIAIIAGRLCSTVDGRFVIRGPGGIGKTCVVLGVAHHAQVQNKYGERILWVPCAEATSPELLLELVSRSVGVTIETPGRDRKEKILSVLRSKETPILVILDNFETPWGTSGAQSAVTDILQTLTSVAGVSMLLTTRGSSPPAAGRIAWTKPQLEPLSTLSLEASRQLYLSIHDEAAAEDAHLDRLLQELSYMPLAVRLVATYGVNSEAMPEALLKKWSSRSIGNMLDQGDDRTESVKFSVSLSIQSSAMQRNPRAVALLAVLAQLPGGARPDFIPEFAPDSDDALTTLKMVSLVQKQKQASTGGFVTMLSPVRNVMLEMYPIDERSRLKLHSAYFSFLVNHSVDVKDANRQRNLVLVAQEHVNCETLLRQALDATPPSAQCIRAAYEFANYLMWTVPDTGILTIAVDKSRSLPAVSDERNELLVLGLLQLGYVLVRRNEYKKSESVLQEAVALCGELGDDLGRAGAFHRLGETYRLLSRYDDAVRVGEEARAIYTKLGFDQGQADALNSLGNAYRNLARFDEAARVAEEAKAIYTRIGYELGEANALRGLANTYHLLDRFEEAVRAGEEAREIFFRLDDTLGQANALASIGLAQRSLKRYDQALRVGEEARKLFEKLGDERGQAVALENIADTYRDLGRFDDALRVGEQTRALYRKSGDEFGYGNATWSLAFVFKRLKRREEALATVRDAIAAFSRIGRDREVGILKRLLVKMQEELGDRGSGEDGDTGV